MHFKPHGFFFCGLLLTLSSCKILLAPGAGGIVATDSGAIECHPGEQCVIDVSTTDFDETFRAIPMEGYEFVQWRRDLKPAFCGKSNKPCKLPTTNFAGNESLMSLLSSDKVFYLAPEFRYIGDGSGKKTFYVGEEEDGSVATVVHADGAVLHAESDDSGNIWTSLEFADGESLIVKSDTEGIPEEMHYNGYIFTFHEFNRDNVLVGVVPPTGDPIYGNIPYTPELASLVSQLTGNRMQAKSVAPAAETGNNVAKRIYRATSAPVAYTQQASATLNTSAQENEKTVTASENLKKGVDAVKLATEIVNTKTLAPLVSRLSRDTKNTVINEVSEQVRKRNQDNTSEKIQIRIWASSGKCLLTVVGSVRTVVLGKVDGCKDLVKDGHAALYNYAIDWKKQQEQVLDRRLDVGGDETLSDLKFSQAVKEMAPTSSLLDGYSVDFRFLVPSSEGAIFPPGEPISLQVRADESDIRYPVECVQLEANFRIYDRLCIWGRDERFIEDTSKVDLLPRGDITLFLPALTEGNYTLRLTSTTLGQQRTSNEFKIVIARIKPPLTLSVAGGGEYPGDTETVALSALVKDADGRELPGNLIEWRGNGKALRRGAKLLLNYLSDGTHDYTALVAVEGRRYQETATVVIGENPALCSDDSRLCELEVNCLGCDVFWSIPVEGNRVRYKIRIRQIPFTLQGREYQAIPAVLHYDPSAEFPGNTKGVDIEAV